MFFLFHILSSVAVEKDRKRSEINDERYESVKEHCDYKDPKNGV